MHRQNFCQLVLSFFFELFVIRVIQDLPTLNRSSNLLDNRPYIFSFAIQQR